MGQTSKPSKRPKPSGRRPRNSQQWLKKRRINRIVRTRRSRLKIARKRLRTKLPRERGDPADRTHSNKSLFFHVCFLNYLQTLSNSFLFKQNLTNCLYIKLFSKMSLLDI